MLTSAVFLALQTGQQVDAQEVAARYLRQLQNATTASGVFDLSLSGVTAGQGTVKFAINREGQFRVTTAVNEELFDGRYKYSRDFKAQTYKVFDSRAAGFPLLSAFEPMVQSKNVQRTLEIFTGTGSPVITNFEGKDAIQMAFGTQRRYINPGTGLPAGYTDTVNGIQYKAAFRQINIDSPLSSDAFVFNHRAGERQVPVVTDGLISVGKTLSIDASSPVASRMNGSILTALVFVRPSNSASADTMNGLADLARRARPKLNVIAISSDNQPAEQYFRGRRTPVPTLRAPELTSAARVSQFPTIVVIDRNGRVVHAEAGGLEGTIKSALQSNGYTF